MKLSTRNTEAITIMLVEVDVTMASSIKTRHTVIPIEAITQQHLCQNSHHQTLQRSVITNARDMVVEKCTIAGATRKIIRITTEVIQKKDVTLAVATLVKGMAVIAAPAVEIDVPLVERDTTAVITTEKEDTAIATSINHTISSAGALLGELTKRGEDQDRMKDVTTRVNTLSNLSTHQIIHPNMATGDRLMAFTPSWCLCVV